MARRCFACGRNSRQICAAKPSSILLRAPRWIRNERLPNMQGGDLLVGSFANNQVGYNRPFPGAGQYRTPIGGLYLCGGSTHPGGNVTGLCGYNSARTVAADLNLPLWWNPPQIESALEAL